MLKKRSKPKSREAPLPEPKPDASHLAGPSPDPTTNLLIADLALRGGAKLVRQGIERGMLGRKYAPKKADQILKGRTLGQSLAHAAIARLATKSIPGAILVGGGLLAKTLYDRRKGRAAELADEAKLDRMAARGMTEDDEVS